MPTHQEKQKLSAWVLTDDFASQIPNDLTVASLIKAGGQGAVFLGTCQGEHAAVKVYYPGQIDQRVEREIAALILLDCPSIVRLQWSGMVNYEGTAIPVTSCEFVRGEDLRDLIDQGPLGEDLIGRLIYDVAEAIRALWARRIIHRDLKPDNIIARENGRFCVIDLGVARHLTDPTLTATGLTWGTLGYLSPEQSKARKALTYKSDVFALGVLAIEAALGRHPTFRNQQRVFSMRMHENLPSPCDSFHFAPLLRRMLSPDPVIRPSSTTILTTLSIYSP